MRRAAGGGLPSRGGERLRRRLSVHAAPDEPGLPAGQAGLVDELEVEESTHTRLARSEPDRFRESPCLALRGEHADRLAAVIPREQARGHLRLVPVLEVPDLSRTAERLSEHRREP